jgi:hypothetical protein
MVGTPGPKPAVDLIDLALEVVDQHDARADVAAPGLGYLEPLQQPVALNPKQIGDRAGARPKLIRVEWTRFLSAVLCLTRWRRKRASSRSSLISSKGSSLGCAIG